MLNTSKKILIIGGTASSLLISGCSNIIKDHGLDYQSAQNSQAALQLPEGQHEVSDKLVIPNEKNIPKLVATGEFDAPRASKPFEPMASLPLSLGQFQAVLTVPSTLNSTRQLITDYFSTFSGEAVTFEAKSENSFISSPVALEQQGKLSKIWSSITRLERPKHQIKLDLEPRAGETIAKVSVVSGDNVVDLTLDEITAGYMIDVWLYLSKQLSQQSALLSKQGDEVAIKSRIWSNREGGLSLYLGKESDIQTVNRLIETTPGLHITNTEPKELALVPQDQLARVGDIVDFKVPLGSLGKDKETVLFKVRRKDLDDVAWMERSYPYDLVRQSEGYFMTLDTSATDHPTLTSFRILSLLAK